MSERTPPSPQGILAGLRVLDLATGLAGSAAALYLAEAGAEVTKLERQRPAADMADDRAVLWRVLDRGKRRLAFDASQCDDRAALPAWLAAADVLVHDLRPSEARALGLDDASLAARHPRLIVAAITGWPRRHALAEAPARETLVLARLGLLDEQPGHRSGPVFVRQPFASWIASWLSVVAVMARLLARERDGRGGAAHTSLAQAALVPMSMHWARAEHPSAAFAKGLSKHIPIPLHRCADGRWIHVHYSPDAAPWMAEGLAALGPAGVARENARFPPSHVAPNFGANKAVIATRPAQDWVTHFWAHDVAAQIAAPFGEIYGDVQARLNGYAMAVQDPVLGCTWQPGPAYMSDPPPQVAQGLRGLEPLIRGPGSLDPAFGETAMAVADGAAAGEPVGVAHGAGQAPLQGLKVLDLGAYLAGPFACLLLADLGAEVIKVEPPAGDAMRRLERVFAGTQRGKRGLALKLGEAGSAPVLAALVDWADVVHHNMRLPAARKLGIAPEQLRAGRPALVCAHVSAYGPMGPRADWPGFGVGDHLAALASVFAVLLALYRRGQTGEGQAVAASLLGVMLGTVAETVAFDDGRSTPVATLDAAQMRVSTTHGLYACRDGWIAVAALEAAEAAAFEAMIATDAERHFASLAQAQAVAALQAVGVPAEPVRLAQGEPFLDSADHASAGLHAHYRHADLGHLQQVGAFWDFGDLPLQIGLPPPALGEHSAALLSGLGFEPLVIDALQRAGLVHLRPQPVAGPV